MSLPPRWQERVPLPTPRAGLALAVYEGQLYAIGGETSDGVVGSVTRYDPQSDTWVARASKPTPVTDARAALLGGRIFVPGGRAASGQVTDKVEVYDPESDSWTVATSLPDALSAYALTAFEGQLYLFGGWDGSRFVATTYAYDPVQDTWTTRASMLTARGYAGAVVADGKIFVVGGYDGQHDLTANEEYVPSKDNDGEGSPWAIRAPLPTGRGGAGVTVAANLIHVIGGGWTEGQPASMKYNVRDDRWDEFETPTTGVWRNMGVGAVDTKIYCVGGWDGVQPVASNREYQALYVIIIPMAITPAP
jgi:N-acetylneuraminic acid mutarotase